MSSGLIALLDDVAGLARVAAASLDGATGQAAKAASKAAGVVIDDTAVTPGYVVGFAAERELPIIGKIALGSLKNKLLFLLPAALLLSVAAPWAIQPLLMVGGVYLCYEGYEKVAEMLGLGGHHGAEDGAEDGTLSGAALEAQKVRSAISTDFILSAEIMAITLANVAEASFGQKVFVLAVVGIGVTLGVYGLVALIVKADDVGVAMARVQRPVSGLVDRMAGRGGDREAEPNGADRLLAPAVRAIGRGLVNVMPRLLSLLSTVGTAAMLWVGGGILLHGAEHYGWHLPGEFLHGVQDRVAGLWPAMAGALSWLVEAAVAAVLGIIVGAVAAALTGTVLAPLVRLVRRTA